MGDSKIIIMDVRRSSVARLFDVEMGQMPGTLGWHFKRRLISD
jgi:hypothetical protein